MTRILIAGLAGLLAFGAASALAATRTSELLIPDVSLSALDDTGPKVDDAGDGVDEPDGAVPVDGSPVGDAAETDVVDILLVGSDSRAGLTEDQMDRMEAHDHGGALTDTILWVQYLPESGSLRMLAFPRDIAVQTVEHGLQKINALHPLDGPNALVEHLEAMVGEELEHYVEMDLAGLVALTDAVGGVEVCLDEPLVDPVVGTIEAGCNVLDGIDAGRFVRARQTSDSFGSGTLGRAARQQYFLRQALGKVLSAGTLANPARLRALVDVVSDSVVVDDGLGLVELYGLAEVFRDVDPEQVESAIVPVVGFGQDDVYYERLDDRAQEVFRALRDRTPMPTGESSDPSADSLASIDQSP